jgi:hypothetical protein
MEKVGEITDRLGSFLLFSLFVVMIAVGATVMVKAFVDLHYAYEALTQKVGDIERHLATQPASAIGAGLNML